jgi:hypothetical protein
LVRVPVASRYRIRAEIARGGSADVFEAEMIGEQGFVRRVAIKRMSREAAADQRLVRAFVDEARILAALNIRTSPTSSTSEPWTRFHFWSSSISME